MRRSGEANNANQYQAKPDVSPSDKEKEKLPHEVLAWFNHEYPNYPDEGKLRVGTDCSGVESPLQPQRQQTAGGMSNIVDRRLHPHVLKSG